MFRKMLLGLMMAMCCAGAVQAAEPALNGSQANGSSASFELGSPQPEPTRKCVNIGTGVQECTYCRPQESTNQTVCTTYIVSHVPHPNSNWDP